MPKQVFMAYGDNQIYALIKMEGFDEISLSNKIYKTTDKPGILLDIVSDEEENKKRKLYVSMLMNKIKTNPNKNHTSTHSYVSFMSFYNYDNKSSTMTTEDKIKEIEELQKRINELKNSMLLNSYIPTETNIVIPVTYTSNQVFSDDVAIVYNNSYQHIIDDLKFDYVITDPPYNVGYDYPDYKDSLNSGEYIELLSPLNKYSSVMIHYAEAFCGDVGEAMGKPNRCVSWCYSSNLPRQSRTIAWFGCSPDFTKVKQPYKNPTDKRIKKLIENGSEGSRLYDWWNDIQLVKNVSKEKAQGFTNQIPVQLLERIILLTTKPGDTILDPFFGSGSLYFACKNTGRKCIGVEQSSKHIDVFFERLKSHNTENITETI